MVVGAATSKLIFSIIFSPPQECKEKEKEFSTPASGLSPSKLLDVKEGSYKTTEGTKEGSKDVISKEHAKRGSGSKVPDNVPPVPGGPGLAARLDGIVTS